MRRNRTIVVRLSDGEYDSLMAAVDEFGRTSSREKFVREAVFKYIEFLQKREGGD